MDDLILGFDIGGTKCAVMTAEVQGENIEFLKKEKCATRFDISPEEMIESLIKSAENILDGEKPEKIGISCGGPLDSRKGVILGPPNLPGWNGVHISEQLSRHFGVPALLQNDANACAVAEWKFGAGRGADNMVFLTFGTGLGAGLSVLIDILNPEKIVIGSVFARSEQLLRKYAEEVIAKEALPQAAGCLRKKRIFAFAFPKPRHLRCRSCICPCTIIFVLRRKRCFLIENPLNVYYTPIFRRISGYNICVYFPVST